jgi:DNA-binding MarR family transcriptional regulator
MRDEVDRLVEAWQRERPDLDVTPMAVLSRVTRLAKHLDRARRQSFGRHGLDAAEFDVLAALRRAGPPYELTPGALMTQTMVSSGTVTHRVDKLQARGLVRRRPDPTDGRVVRVRLSARGRTRVDAALADLLDREQALLAGLSDRQRASLARLLRTVVAPFDSAGRGAAF